MIYKYYNEITGESQTNPAYKEILKLNEMLIEAGIPHNLRTFMDGWQIVYPDVKTPDDCVMDAIEHWGSYGKEADKLEIMGLLTPKEKECDSVLGHLTAEDVFERIRKHYNGEWDDYIKSLSKLNGDIYFNPLFGDLWIVDDDQLIKINDGYDIPLDEPNNFIKVGHVDWAAIRDVSNGE